MAPPPKKVLPEPEKPKSKKEQLDEDIKDLYKYLKKSYEKNKPKLDKMTPIKYKNAIKRQNNKFLTEFKEIYQDNTTFIHVDDIQKADKRFYKIIPEEKPTAKLSELDSMEKSILDDLEKRVKKNKYSDQLDVYELLDVGEGLEKPLRKRTLEIIEKIVKKKSLRTLFPLKDLKKRLKL